MVKLRRVQPRTLVVFHYYEANEDYRANLRYFLEHGYDTRLDYIVVIAGGCTVELPRLHNIRYEFVPNRDFDYGGFSHAVLNVLRGRLDGHDHFFFVNCSARGPFLPAYWTGSWIEPFTDMLRGDVKLVGSTICMPPPTALWSHVQSMVYAMDREALQHLVDSGFWGRELGGDKSKAIADYEVRMSRAILEKGWRISCLQPPYRDLDYREEHAGFNPSARYGDPLFEGAYFGRTLHPLEMIFVKTNRQLADGAALAQLASQQPRTAASAYEADPRERIMGEVVSAWTGHRNFAGWLVDRIRPTAIADLGVDFGFSTFCFAQPGIGHVYGVDSFEGDPHAGFRDTRRDVLARLAELGLGNVTLVKGYFEQVASTWDKPLDILHIDGLHTYEAVLRDYVNWVRFVRAGGVVLFHDTCVPDFGVRRLFDEIDLPKTNFRHSYGLGVVSMDRDLVAEIARKFSTLIEPGTTRV